MFAPVDAVWGQDDSRAVGASLLRRYAVPAFVDFESLLNTSRGERGGLIDTMSECGPLTAVGSRGEDVVVLWDGIQYFGVHRGEQLVDEGKRLVVYPVEVAKPEGEVHGCGKNRGGFLGL